MSKYDFSGWATKSDIRCSDGRTIKENAFADCDGKIVPLVWNHQHNEPENVLGHALLKNVKGGVRAYGYFNNTDSGQRAKQLVDNGDIASLSIYANQLKQNGGDVLHGTIREVSLVLASANPGACIDTLSHSDDGDFDDAIIYQDMPLVLYHSDKKDEDEPEEEKESKEEKEGEEKMAEKTVKDVIDEMTEEQKNVMYYMIGQALEEGGAEDDEEDEEPEMKHNVFETDYTEDNYLTHADEAGILELAKQPGMTFQMALASYGDMNGMELQHDAISSGFDQDTTHNGNVTWLFPEYKDVRPGAPELITNDQGWVNTVMNKVHKSPISRVRTSQVDIREIDSLRARGYQKGKQKKITGNFNLVRRTTDPQTVYVKSQLHRDDVVDITDFDYVQYLYNIDKMNLNEELATAIVFGDGRPDSSEDKIFPEHIRPIYLDDELYTLHRDLDVATYREELQGTETASYFGDNFVRSEAMVATILYAREDYRGSGKLDMLIAPHELNVMLLARDRNGNRLYRTKADLASAFDVNSIITCEQMSKKRRTVTVEGTEVTKKPLAILCDFSDYTVGATKGGELTHFTDFDIDFNQLKSLLEVRCSGALTRVYSAIAIEENVVNSGNNSNPSTQS